MAPSAAAIHNFGMKSSGRHDAETMVSSRLKEPWSAVAFASTCKEEVLRTVQGRYHDLEQHVRLRILLAALALRKGPAQAMAALLGRMAEDAQIDEDDWVQVFGHAVGDFTSPLWLSRVAENVPSVSARLFSHTLACLPCRPAPLLLGSEALLENAGRRWATC
jgi:hypothetical protein